MRKFESSCVTGAWPPPHSPGSSQSHAEAARGGIPAEHAVITTKLSGEITDWNAGAERLFGRPRSEVLGMSAQILVPPEHRGNFADFLDTVRRNTSVHRQDIVCLRNGGARIDVSLTASTLHESDGTP